MVVRNNYCFTNATGVIADEIVIIFSSSVSILTVNGKDPNSNDFPYNLKEEENNTKISIQHMRYPSSLELKIRIKSNEDVKVKSAIWILDDGNHTPKPIDLSKYDPLC